MEPLSIGIDFGARGLRVAFAAEAGRLVSVEHGLAPDVPWLRCERSASSLGVSFPSLKSSLGSSGHVSDGHHGWPSQKLTEAFARARRGIEEQTYRSVRQATVCVPARYPTQPRAAVLEAAFAAGFTDVDLITDSVGAVLAHTAVRPPPATVLVFGAGYDGVELGLIRTVKGHLRVLGYENGVTAGAALDGLLMNAWARALGPIVSRARWSTAEWMTIREAAETVKENLGTDDEVVFPIDVTDRFGKVRSVAFSRQGFEEVVKQAFQPVVDSLGSLLDKGRTALSDIDAVVLVGGTTRIPRLRALLREALGQDPVIAPPGTLAFGAALHSSGLGSRFGDEAFPFERETEDSTSGGPEDGVLLQATAVVTRSQPDTEPASYATLAADEGPSVAQLLAPGALQRFVAEHMDAGEIDRARAELGKLIREAQSALDELPAAHANDETNPTSPTYRSRLALANARAHLAQRRFPQAVSESHQAWKRLPDDPEVLDQMIDIHCDAAIANGAFEQYKDAIRWLMCAFSHDESNTRTRSLLAQRHYTHAQDLHSRGRTKDALEAAEQCLIWDPEHAGAAELHRALISG